MRLRCCRLLPIAGKRAKKVSKPPKKKESTRENERSSENDRETVLVIATAQTLCLTISCVFAKGSRRRSLLDPTSAQLYQYLLSRFLTCYYFRHLYRLLQRSFRKPFHTIYFPLYFALCTNDGCFFCENVNLFSLTT